jgi:hypothetical protein
LIAPSATQGSPKEPKPTRLGCTPQCFHPTRICGRRNANRCRSPVAASIRVTSATSCLTGLGGAGRPGGAARDLVGGIGEGEPAAALCHFQRQRLILSHAAVRFHSSSPCSFAKKLGPRFISLPNLAHPGSSLKNPPMPLTRSF